MSAARVPIWRWWWIQGICMIICSATGCTSSDFVGEWDEPSLCHFEVAAYDGEQICLFDLVDRHSYAICVFLLILSSFLSLSNENLNVHYQDAT